MAILYINNETIIKVEGLVQYMKRKVNNDVLQKRKLMNEIKAIQLSMECAYSQFENVTDPDLIDSCIYQINSVQTKYKYLLNALKKY